MAFVMLNYPAPGPSPTWRFTLMHCWLRLANIFEIISSLFMYEVGCEFLSVSDWASHQVGTYFRDNSAINKK